MKVCIHYLVKPEKITLLSGNLCLCNLLKFQKGGHFLLSPVQELNKYVAKSNILREGISLRVLSTSSQVHAACSGQIPLLSKVSVFVLYVSGLRQHHHSPVSMLPYSHDA